MLITDFLNKFVKDFWRVSELIFDMFFPFLKTFFLAWSFKFRSRDAYPSSQNMSFFQAAVVSILLYGCTTWTLTKRIEKKLDSNYTRMRQAILNNPGGSTPQSSSYTVTYHPSRKLSNLDETDMWVITGEVRTNT